MYIPGVIFGYRYTSLGWSIVMVVLRLLFVFTLSIFSVHAWSYSPTSTALNYNYDVVGHFPIDQNIKADTQNNNYDSTPNLRYCCSNSLNTDLHEKALSESFFAVVDGFVVTKGTKPAISPQKQAGHIPGTPQNANRLRQGKPTSSFFGEKSGERLTQQAFEKGKPVPGRPNVREHDFGVSTGTGPNGGMQTRVRVHQDSKGRIHGHPSGSERY